MGAEGGRDRPRPAIMEQLNDVIDPLALVMVLPGPLSPVVERLQDDRLVQPTGGATDARALRGSLSIRRRCEMGGMVVC